MHPRFRLQFLQIHSLLRLHSSVYTTSYSFISRKFLVFPIPFHSYHHISSVNFTENHKPTNPLLQNSPANASTDYEALKIQTLFKNHFDEPAEEIEQLLEKCPVSLSEDLILNVLKRHRSNWKPAYTFFRWVCKAKNSSGFPISTTIYNEILDILGRMKRFEEALQVLDEMSRRKNLINERTFGIVLNRLAAAHKVDEAIEFYNKMEDLGLERNLIAFQTLLLSLCRYKHVEIAEFLFRNKKSEFEDEIKTWNIILNGWCVLRSLPDAKRFWKDIIASKCKPDKFTYGIFINSLSKSGKITTSMNLLTAMWEKGINPDATICNTVVDGLCFKKRIPEALHIFNEMKVRNCAPNISTYNSLVKHLCKIQRMEKVDELLDEMEERCSPNAFTYGYLLKAAKKREEVDEILERMKQSGCEMGEDSYNLVLRLFVKLGDEEKVKCVWNDMERSGRVPDRRSYTVVVHGFYERGKIGEALEYFDEMIVKGIVPEYRTKLFVDDMKSKLNDRSCSLKKSFPLKQTRQEKEISSFLSFVSQREDKLES